MDTIVNKHSRIERDLEKNSTAQRGTTSCLEGAKRRHWSAFRADCTARGRFEWTTNNQLGW